MCAYLNKIPSVYNQRSANGTDIDPLVLVKDLEAATVVLEKYCQERRVRVLRGSESKIWLRTWRVIVCHHELILGRIDVFEVVRSEAKSFGEQLAESISNIHHLLPIIQHLPSANEENNIRIIYSLSLNSYS